MLGGRAVLSVVTPRDAGHASLLSVIHFQKSTINRALKSSLGTSASLTFVHQVREVFLLQNGIVKSFDDSKGYGWIVPTDGTKDLFVHQRNILGNDIRTLPIDAKVTYESRTNDKGLEAINVSLMK